MLQYPCSFTKNKDILIECKHTRSRSHVAKTEKILCAVETWMNGCFCKDCNKILWRFIQSTYTISKGKNGGPDRLWRSGFHLVLYKNLKILFICCLQQPKISYAMHLKEYDSYEIICILSILRVKSSQFKLLQFYMQSLE